MGQTFDFAQSVPDFRRNSKGNFRHNLADMLVLIMLARMSGHYVRPSIIAFGKHYLKNFQKMDLLLNGVPSEATLCRVENGIDDLKLADCMRQFMEAFYNELISMACVMEVISVDGKAMRGTVLETDAIPTSCRLIPIPPALYLPPRPAARKATR